MTVLAYKSQQSCSVHGAVTILAYVSQQLCSVHDAVTVLAYVSRQLCSVHYAVTVVALGRCGLNALCFAQCQSLLVSRRGLNALAVVCSLAGSVLVNSAASWDSTAISKFFEFAFALN
eukprot:697391-Amphidinium_carterae.1